MGKSKAKKMREKMDREGLRNPELSRGVFALADMRTRTTKTKQGKMNQVKHKGRVFDQDGKGSDNCFYYAIKKYA